MTAIERREFIFRDEWLGAFLCTLLYLLKSPAFPYVFIFWAICVYVISYPLHWYQEYLESKSTPTTLACKVESLVGNRPST